MTDMPSGGEIFAGVDLGGTTISVGLGDSNGQILQRKTIPTLSERGPEDVLGRIAELVRELRQSSGTAVDAVGIGVPGLLDLQQGTSLFLPNMAGQWRRIPIVEILTNALKMPIRILNDVRTATLGEMRFGRGKGIHNLVFFSLGTGIGGGVVTQGRLLLGPLGSAGEIGHQTILPDGPLCGCGNHGCLEALASGPAITAEGIRLWKMGLAPALMEICQGNLDRVSPMTMAQASNRGDSSIADAIHRAATFLGIGVANLVTSLHPELVVLGGGVSQLGSLLLDPVKAVIKQRVRMFPPDDVRVECSTLGDGAGLLGAIALAADFHFSGAS